MKDRTEHLHRFKAKRLDDGVWIEGSLIFEDERYFICPLLGIKSIDNVTNRNADTMIQLYAYEIDYSTLSRFTGLTDGNNNWIWENDIVLYDDELYVISWDDNDACFRLEIEGLLESFANIWGRDCEVYGNIFDNRELLYPEEEYCDEAYGLEEST